MIAVVDTEEKIESAINAIKPMIDEGLIVLSDVDVIHLAHSIPFRKWWPASRESSAASGSALILYEWYSADHSTMGKQLNRYPSRPSAALWPSTFAWLAARATAALRIASRSRTYP